MKRVIGAAVICAFLALFALAIPQAAQASDATATQEKIEAPQPADRVVVMYFHRTQRCPTCLRMGGYSEEAVVKGFAEEIEAGTVEFHYVDFQDPENAALAQAYDVTGPALVAVKVVKNKPVDVENLKDIWARNADKDAFLSYVRDHVAAYVKTMRKTPADRVVVVYFHRTQRCPTCLKMGGYSEEAVAEGFPDEVKAGTVEFRYVDFQDSRNATLVKAYKITGPTLVVLKVERNKPVASETLTEIWTKNRDKEVFLQYVRDNVAALQKPLPETARKAQADTLAPNAM